MEENTKRGPLTSDPQQKEVVVLTADRKRQILMAIMHGRNGNEGYDNPIGEEAVVVPVVVARLQVHTWPLPSRNQC